MLEDEAEDLTGDEAEAGVVRSTKQLSNVTTATNWDIFSMNVQMDPMEQTMQSWRRKKRFY